MTIAFLLMLGIAAILGVVSWVAVRQISIESEARMRAETLAQGYWRAIQERDAYIAKVGKINAEKGGRLEKVSAGSDDDKFDTSLNVLSDLSKPRP